MLNLDETQLQPLFRMILHRIVKCGQFFLNPLMQTVHRKRPGADELMCTLEHVRVARDAVVRVVVVVVEWVGGVVVGGRIYARGRRLEVLRGCGWLVC